MAGAVAAAAARERRKRFLPVKEQIKNANFGRVLRKEKKKDNDSFSSAAWAAKTPSTSLDFSLSSARQEALLLLFPFDGFFSTLDSSCGRCRGCGVGPEGREVRGGESNAIGGHLAEKREKR